MSGPRALIYEKNLHRAAELRRILDGAGWACRAVFYQAEAQTIAAGGGFEVLIAGADTFPLPPALDEMKIVISAPRGETGEAARVIERYGLSALVIEYPYRAEEVLAQLKKLGRAEPRRAEDEGEIAAILGVSPAIRKVKELLLKAAQVPATVLVLGETGTGKELAARALHEMGPRGKGPFVAINCAALPETLLETELFGHERGAFTGADSRKIGKFEAAHKGTIFLDEIGDISPAMQVKLLRVLDSGTFNRVGGNAPIHVDARVVCATNQDIFEMALAGRFRRDLLYRINVVAVQMPPLRERTEDLPLLAEHFLKLFSERFGKPALAFAPAVLEKMKRYRWPGNVRQLEHAVERAVIHVRGAVVEEVSLEDSGEAATAPPDPAELAGMDHAAMKERVLDYYEREYLSALLKKERGSLQAACEKSGMDRKTLYRKMKQYGLDKKDFK